MGVCDACASVLLPPHLLFLIIGGPHGWLPAILDVVWSYVRGLPVLLSVSLNINRRYWACQDRSDFGLCPPLSRCKL